LQYLGTRYAGWQMQANATGVQSVFEEVLERLFGTSIRVEGAGRTDSGVHARAQRAHADVPFAIELRGLRMGMNDLLPHDIAVTVSADGFLRYMVRRIAGSLIEIGRGKLDPTAIWSEARWTAPAKGLTLWEIRY